MARFAVALLVAAMAVTMVSAGGKATWTDCSSSSATAKVGVVLLWIVVALVA